RHAAGGAMMAQASGTDLTIRYEGVGSGAHEIWGGTQANFIVRGAGMAGAREVAVMLNDPAAAFLAETLGAENTEEFRADAAHVVGEAVIRDRYARIGRVESLITVSRATLDVNPGLVGALRT
ncbi:MAG: hypothetical protein ACRDHY_12880, partial [Anaerolineales bacterium]